MRTSNILITVFGVFHLVQTICKIFWKSAADMQRSVVPLSRRSSCYWYWAYNQMQEIRVPINCFALTPVPAALWSVVKAVAESLLNYSRALHSGNSTDCSLSKKVPIKLKDTVVQLRRKSCSNLLRRHGIIKIMSIIVGASKAKCKKKIIL